LQQAVVAETIVKMHDGGQGGVHPMCDYSLNHVASRPAKVGDELVTTRFTETYTRGFSAVGQPDVAVCLLPGTEVAFTNEPKCDHLLAWLLPGSKFGAIGERVARFRQLNLDQPGVHHDALEFPSGKTILLTRLLPGQRATVLQLPARTHKINASQKQQPFQIVR
jgi:hypothetical protein